MFSATEVVMKKILTCLAFAACATFAFATTASAKLPADMEEFKARYEAEAKTPEGAAKLWLEAAFLYSDPSTRHLGRDIFVVLMRKLPKDFERNAAHSVMVDKLKNESHIMRSFCAGTSPENGYTTDLNKCEITVTQSKEGYENTWNLWLKSSGSDSNRQVTLTKDGDHWQVSNAAGLYMGIRPPQK
jgi:hypothetical protein